MNALSTALKTILNGLAMQHAGDYLSDEEKSENLRQVREAIAREQAVAPAATSQSPRDLTTFTEASANA